MLWVDHNHIGFIPPINNLVKASNAQVLVNHLWLSNHITHNSECYLDLRWTGTVMTMLR